MQIENILKSDIFFFVTTIAVVVVTLLSVVVSVYAIKILRDIRFMVGDIKFKYHFVQKFINYLIK